ncbi:DUF6575 domain-containing protein [Aliidiomarina sp. Khilg15.8]
MMIEFHKDFLQTRFGKLSISNVYAYYDEPTLFTAKNEFGQLHFCYWIGVTAGIESWVINPVSEQLVNNLEQKKIPVAELIKPKGYKKIFIVSENIQTGEITEQEVMTSRNLPFTLPDSNIHIFENLNIDGSRKHTHRVRINKDGKSLYLSDKLADIFGAFSDFFHALREPLDVASNLQAIDAIPGSFNFRVKASNIDELRDKAYSTFESVSSVEGLRSLIAAGEVDLLQVRKIFSVLSQHKTDIELIEEASTETVLRLSAEDVESLIPTLDEKLSSYLNSTMVPQADHMDSIKRYIELVDTQGFVTPESFSKTKRQVSYYRDAVEILGLLHPYGKLTPRGIKALDLERAEFIKLVQEQFEETECGYIWMNSAGVTAATELDENSAGDFLIEYCRGLSEATAKRRGSTLKRWVEEFKALTP